MKKAITILAILAIVVAAVFATTETHNLQVVTEVPGSQPVFQLINGDDATKKTNTADNATKDGVEGLDFAANTYTVDSAIDKTGTDISKNDVTGSVIARLNSYVKLANTTPYTLTFTANRLASSATHDGATFYINPVMSTTSNTSSVVPNTTSLDAGITLATTTALDVSGNTITGVYTATMDTTNIEACDLFTFNFVYPATEAAPVDTYTAYITLTVQAS